MDSQVVAALIGAGGALAGALITVFASDLRARWQTSASSADFLLGEWSCEWTYDPRAYSGLEQYEDAVVRDSVVIEQVKGKAVHAHNKNQDDATAIGDYVLDGRISSTRVLTLVYVGKEKEGLVGTVILKLDFTGEEMRGHWTQINPSGAFVGGATVWRKRR